MDRSNNLWTAITSVTQLNIFLETALKFSANQVNNNEFLNFINKHYFK